MISKLNIAFIIRLTLVIENSITLFTRKGYAFFEIAANGMEVKEALCMRFSSACSIQKSSE